MSDDKPLKSAYELAMERLRAEDAEPRRELNDEQKREISELREQAQAKLAELEIMHRQNVAAALGDPEKLAEVEQHYRTDRERVASSLESKVARVRQGS